MELAKEEYMPNDEQDGQENRDNQKPQDDSAQAGQGNAAKDTEDWKTGNEPATPAQLSYISTMAVEAKEEVSIDLTKAEASKKINELQEKTGRDTSSERP